MSTTLSVYIPVERRTPPGQRHLSGGTAGPITSRPCRSTTPDRSSSKGPSGCLRRRAQPASYVRSPGDANSDGRVDINDLTVVLAHYGQTGQAWTQGEFTGDGTVDINDLTIVLAHYGQSVALRGRPIRGPEPASLLMLVAMFLAVAGIAVRAAGSAAVRPPLPVQRQGRASRTPLRVRDARPRLVSGAKREGGVQSFRTAANCHSGCREPSF